MEEVIYKHRPHIYAAVSIVALLLSRNSPLLAASGLILLLCSAYVLKARSDYKKEMVRITTKYAHSQIKHQPNVRF